MHSLDAALARQHDAAAKRVLDGTKRRQGKIRVLGEPGGIARADVPERVATRIDRLSHYHPDIAIVEDFVTIVQHPGGEKKQVALRENRVVDVLELFLHYETDTEPGSSGSPIFNDQWEVVALHHASVPAPEHGELGGIVNEGIRVSQLH